MRMSTSSALSSDCPTIVLEGGLGNRMRVAAAAWTMSRQLGMPMRVLWTSQWGMRCRLDSLFEPLEPSGGEPSFVLRDAEGVERLLFARARRANLYLPRVAQRCLYRHIITSPQIYYLQRDGFDFGQWFRQGRVLMMAYRDFCTWQPEVLGRLFRPVESIRRRTDERCASFTPYTIGVHVRRTDSQQSIDESPIELFFERIDHYINVHAGAHVYLATDDEDTKTQMRKRYGRRIVTSKTEATRESTEGIQDALVEMLTLSRTSLILGSSGSTFSEIAAKWGGIALEVVRKTSN